MTPTNDLTVHPPSDLSGLDRLHAMREVAEKLLAESDLPRDRWQIEINWNRELHIRQFPRHSRNQPVWSLYVGPPIEVMGEHQPASIQCHGKITPLVLAVITAINDVFWEDRER